MAMLAIDPGNKESGYVIVDVFEEKIQRILDLGKVKNKEILDIIQWSTLGITDIGIEMVASYGMAVGATVFDTCVWIGRFWQQAKVFKPDADLHRIYRKDEKICICGSMKAKDSNIRQALVDIYAPGEDNYGKGTKNRPGFFYGFKSDIWQAFAVAHTYVEKYGF